MLPHALIDAATSKRPPASAPLRDTLHPLTQMTKTAASLSALRRPRSNVVLRSLSRLPDEPTLIANENDCQFLFRHAESGAGRGETAVRIRQRPLAGHAPGERHLRRNTATQAPAVARALEALKGAERALKAAEGR
jgi:hypothetical protein